MFNDFTKFFKKILGRGIPRPKSLRYVLSQVAVMVPEAAQRVVDPVEFFA